MGKEINWEEVQAKFESFPAGTLLKGGDGNYYIKPVHDSSFHTDHMMMDLFTGELKHFTSSIKLTPVYGFEIPW